MRVFDLHTGGSAVSTGHKVAIRNPYDGTIVGDVFFAGSEEIETTIETACNAFPAFSQTPAHERSSLLRGISSGISGRKDEYAEIIRDEAGKPIRLARIEVERAISTFSIAAEEASRIEGELLPLDNVPHGAGRTGLVKRYPIGPVLAITPFNFPLNLVAHKVAPSIAAGNCIIVKPSSQTPMSSLLLSQIARNAGLPSGVLSVLPCASKNAETMTLDPRFKMLTFTGSPAVGWKLKNQAGRKRVTLELGGNAAAIIEPDSNIEEAATMLANNAFAYAGQVCISLQRIFIHESIAKPFSEYFASYVSRTIHCGDPSNPEIICGPVIDSASADRIEEWIGEAVQKGARILCGGQREGHIIQPTVLADVDPELRIARSEVFGPVVIIDSYTSFDEAIGKVNDSDYGLQAGVFTQDTGKIMKAFRELQVGAVIHNDGPGFRVDSMPYGGTKDSGMGREGLRYAIEEMTESRLLVLRE